MSGAAQRHTAVREHDLEARAARVLASAEDVISQLAADPDRRYLQAAVCELGGHLEDVRRALADYNATNAVLELAVQAGREAERTAAAPRRRKAPDTVPLRLAQA